MGALSEALGSRPLLLPGSNGSPDLSLGLDVLQDVVPGVGALGGILTAVEAAAPVVCVAWDMPFVPAGLLRELAAAIEGGAADVVVPESGSLLGIEPLCAAYGPACGPAARAALQRGDRRAYAFHGSVRVTRLPLDAVLKYGDPDVLFLNVNTPEDLQRAEAVCRDHGSSR